MASKGRVCLAYSGGLDTSAIALWLIQQGYEVVCFTADVGQKDDFELIKQKAKEVGAVSCHIVDCRAELVEEMCWAAIQCNAIYENVYLLGTSLARPIIARAQVAIAKQTSCQYISHGATGKGNDQIRLELGYMTLSNLTVIAPWRDHSFTDRFRGRLDLIKFCEESGIKVTSTRAKPYSVDENLIHSSFESGCLEKPDFPPPDDMWNLTTDPLTSAADEPEDVTIDFEKGIPVKISSKSIGTETEPLKLFLAANALGSKHGIGRVDIVENRLIGLKSRGCYESPGIHILRAAHIDIESITMDRDVRALRDQFVTFNWSQLIYNGEYFSAARSFLHQSIIESQKTVNGKVLLRLYKGNVIIRGRSSETEHLYDENLASMDTLDDFDPVSSGGFIDVLAIRLKKYGQMKAEKGESL